MTPTKEQLVSFVRSAADEQGNPPSFMEFVVYVEEQGFLPTVHPFKSWHHLQQAAGFNAVPFSKEDLTLCLYYWMDKHGRVPLQIEFHSDPTTPSMRIVRELFGSWNEFLTECAIGLRKNTLRIPRESKRDVAPEDLIEAIGQLVGDLGRNPTHKECCTYLHKIGMPVDPRNVLKLKWNDILKAIGRKPSIWTNVDQNTALQILVDRIQQYGYVPSMEEVNNDPSMPSCYVYQKLFGSWNTAVEMAGHKPNQRARWDEAELIERLLNLAQRLGRTPGMADADCDQDTPHPSIYAKHFGGYRAALHAAGLKASRQRCSIPYESNHGHIRPSIAEGMLDDHLCGIPHEHDVPYKNYVHTHRRYTFDAVILDSVFIERAGYLTRRQWLVETPVKKGSMAAAYRTTLTEKMALLSNSNFSGEVLVICNDDDIDAMLGPIILKYGGLGCTMSGRPVIQERLYNFKKGQKYSDEELLANILEMSEILGRTPTLDDMDRDGWPYKSIYTKRRPWTEWLRMAGLPVDNIHKYSDQELFEHLRSVESELGRLPTRADISRTTPSEMAYCRRFGSTWDEVLKAYSEYKKSLPSERAESWQDHNGDDSNNDYIVPVGREFCECMSGSGGSEDVCGNY